MKLSELSTDRALDVLCELTPCIANIMEDEQIVNGLDAIMPDRPSDAGESGEKKNGTNKIEQNGFVVGVQMMGGLSKLAPVLLRNHRDDVYTILSVLNEKTTAEIAAQPVMDTIRQVREVLQDTELLSFFKSSAQQGQTEQSVPSAGFRDSE